MADELCSDDGLRAAIGAYRQMADEEQPGRSYTKSLIRDQLLAGPLENRSKGSYEYRMADLSAVLDEHGAPWPSGYKPARNVGANVKATMMPLLRSEGPVRSFRVCHERRGGDV